MIQTHIILLVEFHLTLISFIKTFRFILLYSMFCFIFLYRSPPFSCVLTTSDARKCQINKMMLGNLLSLVTYCLSEEIVNLSWRNEWANELCYNLCFRLLSSFLTFLYPWLRLLLSPPSLDSFPSSDVSLCSKASFQWGKTFHKHSR